MWRNVCHPHAAESAGRIPAFLVDAYTQAVGTGPSCLHDSPTPASHSGHPTGSTPGCGARKDQFQPRLGSWPVIPFVPCRLFGSAFLARKDRGKIRIERQLVLRVLRPDHLQATVNYRADDLHAQVLEIDIFSLESQNLVRPEARAPNHDRHRR